MPRRPSADIAHLVRNLDQTFGSRGWHGTTLLGSLRGLAPDTALWRPGPDRHNIWELILHTAYWKYAVRRRITAAGDERFPRSPSDWPDLPDERGQRALRRDIALLKTEHATLVDAIEALTPADLRKRSPRGQWTWREMVTGVAAHDAYHTGQIQLIKRLMPRL